MVLDASLRKLSANACGILSYVTIQFNNFNTGTEKTILTKANETKLLRKYWKIIMAKALDTRERYFCDWADPLLSAHW